MASQTANDYAVGRVNYTWLCTEGRVKLYKSQDVTGIASTRVLMTLLPESTRIDYGRGVIATPLTFLCVHHYLQAYKETHKPKQEHWDYNKVADFSIPTAEIIYPY